MAAYTDAHQLNTVPSWHFLTSPVSTLQTVWRDYNVEVSAPSATADVIHTSVAYFIDPGGHERCLAFPTIAPLLELLTFQLGLSLNGEHRHRRRHSLPVLNQTQRRHGDADVFGTTAILHACRNNAVQPERTRIQVRPRRSSNGCCGYVRSPNGVRTRATALRVPSHSA
jgi:hypothetical protein